MLGYGEMMMYAALPLTTTGTMPSSSFIKTYGRHENQYQVHTGGIVLVIN